MYKKTLLSLAVASSLALTGCFESSSDSKNAGARAEIKDPQFEGKTWPIFNPVTSQLPVPNDLIFDSEAGDGSFDVDIPAGQDDNPVLNALNNLSGASTVAPAVIQFNGKIEEDTVAAGQSVFLLELEYASGDPVRGLSNQEPPTVSRPAPIRADVETLDGRSAIRILPEAPLNPLKRYVVVITKSVRDENGDPISQSPSYAKLTEDDAEPLGVEGLDTVRSLINNLWEPVADTALGDAITPEDMALTYSFTTSDDEKVLRYLANPATWISDQLQRFVATNEAGVRSALARLFRAQRTGEPSGVDPEFFDLDEGASDSQIRAAALTAIGKDPASDEIAVSDFLSPNTNDAEEFEFDDVNYFINDEDDGALANFKPSVALDNSDLVPFDNLPVEEKFSGVAGAVFTGLSGDDSISLPIIQSRAESLEWTSSIDALQKSALLVNAGITDTGIATIHEGSIELPYYLGTPEGESGSNLRTESWKPDSGLAGDLESTFESADLEIPQADEEISTVLNYNFPFPQATNEQNRIPVTAITPTGVSPGDLEETGGEDYTAVIFQHGITLDRSAALAFGSRLVESSDENLVVFAIDQPLHGVAPFSTGNQAEVAGGILLGATLSPEFDLPDYLKSEADGTPSQFAVEGNNIELAISGLLQFAAVARELDYNNNDEFTNEDGLLNLTALLADDTEAAKIQATISAGLDGKSPSNDLDLLVSALEGLQNAVANAGSALPGLDNGANERHFGFTENPDPRSTDAIPMAFDKDDPVGSSGSLFINLENFLNSRDNLRQGSVDLMNLRETINDLEAISDVYFVGHSLGSVNGGAFVAAANSSGNPDLTIAGTHLLAPASGVTRLLENSPSFAPTIVQGLMQSDAAITQGDADYETFLNVNQHTLDTVDPVNFATELADSNILLSQINGDRTVPNAADDKFGDSNGPLGSGDNQTFPIIEDDEVIAQVNIESFPAPLSGSEPLAALLEADDDENSLPTMTRYTEGVHGTPVLPRPNEVIEGGVLKNRTIAQTATEDLDTQTARSVFDEMVLQTWQLIDAGNITPEDPDDVTEN